MRSSEFATRSASCLASTVPATSTWRPSRIGQDRNGRPRLGMRRRRKPFRFPCRRSSFGVPSHGFARARPYGPLDAALFPRRAAATGTAEEVVLAECKMALRDWVARRPHTVFLDLATDTPEAADRANFLSPTHVSNRFMRLIEPRIAAAVNQAKSSVFAENARPRIRRLNSRRELDPHVDRRRKFAHS